VSDKKRQLVLIGGGHSHVQVLRRWAMEPVSDTLLTLVTDTPLSVYSGMVPGFVAGRYRREELEIDVVPLARRAGARVILARLLGVDPQARQLRIEGREPIRYDVSSFDVGSTVAGLELPGIREHALPTRPIGRFVSRFSAMLERARKRVAGEPFRVAVVGAGVGGVELAFTLRERLVRESPAEVAVSLIESGERPLRGYSESLVRRVEERSTEKGIEFLGGRRVRAVEEGYLCFEGGSRAAFDELFWVTGAFGHDLFAESGLATDQRDFVLVRSTLQVEGHDEIFASGDCATLLEHPRTPKAGVYAVRQGPVLSDNLRAFLEGDELRYYRPQGDFLKLLNLGDGSALGSKWGLTVQGRWVMGLKDFIDRRFMRRFQVLDEAGRPTPDFPEMAEMEMRCGGCAGKVGQSVLHRALARLGRGSRDPSVILGLEAGDDAAAVATPAGGVMVSSLDAFRAFTDDPYLVGRAAAVNAASDLSAKGVEARWAQALVAVPEETVGEEAEELLFQVLAGARVAFGEIGVTLLGGHSVTAGELMVGFAVWGDAGSAADLLPLGGLEIGQELLLTKALGTGVIFRADMRARCHGPWFEAALASVLRPNAGAARVAREFGASAATDVTGFGLAGHLGEMARASGVTAVVELDRLPALPGAVELLTQGVRSTFHEENARGRRAVATEGSARGRPEFELLFDPQTAGGLVFGVAPESVAEALESLHANGAPGAAHVGRVIAPREDGALLEVVG